MTIAAEIQHTSGACVVSVLAATGSKGRGGENLKNNKNKPERAEVMSGWIVTLRRKKAEKEVIWEPRGHPFSLMTSL